jgi:hypothetical protein
VDVELFGYTTIFSRNSQTLAASYIEEAAKVSSKHFYTIFFTMFFSKSPSENFVMGYDYVFVLGDDVVLK